MAEKRFSVYFSHSWRPDDVDLNQFVWSEISPHCNLLVDDNVEEKPPYFVNRIEEYIRRSDLFLAVLTYRESPPVAHPPSGPLTGDLTTRCSHASLFEIRLAERARKPRLILYDPRTLFRPGSSSTSQVRYQSFEPQQVLQQGGTYVKDAINAWLDAIGRELTPRILEPNQDALLLVPPWSDRKEVVEGLTAVLTDSGYLNVSELSPSSTDVQVVNRLFSCSLLVADVGESMSMSHDVYAMAHALFLPTIRITRQQGGSQVSELPWMLRGHPYGYEEDLVKWSNLAEMENAVRARAWAMRDTRKLITTHAAGRDFFERKRFKEPHRVFISHNLKPEGRAVIDAIVKRLKDRSIQCWEYRTDNRAADIWTEEMNQAIQFATHAVIILADEYELSEMCVKELEAFIARSNEVMIIPYIWGARTKPNPKLNQLQLHHEALEESPDEAAQQVADRVFAKLTT